METYHISLTKKKNNKAIEMHDTFLYKRIYFMIIAPTSYAVEILRLRDNRLSCLTNCFASSLLIRFCNVPMESANHITFTTKILVNDTIIVPLESYNK